MPFESYAHAAIWQELPADEHDNARAAMRALARFDVPTHSAQVGALSTSTFDGSYRLRVGRYRILFILFAHDATLVFTTAFLKRREGDYVDAIAQHDARVKAHE
ncbi:MAG TPA: hypothetical protein VM370_07840 [Candidatus Thermoplasmatota archaeon]|nr:hypothetical protein [Candidatus Thermoplasmatota archaeon]